MGEHPVKQTKIRRKVHVYYGNFISPKVIYCLTVQWIRAEPSLIASGITAGLGIRIFLRFLENINC